MSNSYPLNRLSKIAAYTGGVAFVMGIANIIPAVNEDRKIGAARTAAVCEYALDSLSKLHGHRVDISSQEFRDYTLGQTLDKGFVYRCSEQGTAKYDSIASAFNNLPSTIAARESKAHHGLKGIELMLGGAALVGIAHTFAKRKTP